MDIVFTPREGEEFDTLLENGIERSAAFLHMYNTKKVAYTVIDDEEEIYFGDEEEEFEEEGLEEDDEQEEVGKDRG